MPHFTASDVMWNLRERNLFKLCVSCSTINHFNLLLLSNTCQAFRFNFNSRKNLCKWKRNECYLKRYSRCVGAERGLKNPRGLHENLCIPSRRNGIKCGNINFPTHRRLTKVTKLKPLFFFCLMRLTFLFRRQTFTALPSRRSSLKRARACAL